MAQSTYRRVLFISPSTVQTVSVNGERSFLFNSSLPIASAIVRLAVFFCRGGCSKQVHMPPITVRTEKNVSESATSVFLSRLMNGALNSQMRANVTTEKAKGCFLCAGITSAMQPCMSDCAQETLTFGTRAMIIHSMTLKSGFTAE